MTVLGVELGSIFQLVTASGVLGMLALMAKFVPEWVRVKSAERLSDSKIAKELRDELMQRLDECETKHNLIIKENEVLRQRVSLLEDGDRRKTVALTLLMNEVSRLDPTSDIIIRAKAVLELSLNLTLPTDPNIEQALHKLEREK